ncbi:adenylosuccinate synthase [Spiroplasma apis]|uniref:Adenylosuccinate synthetase n=1 Tax=Spiroplasma apis B31 TaxID=1276258 RepID=V5RJE6_SPIAP|nr:adenylosuccinate synthase [Spiroplasma apis]AHB36827.1 adenylosuccinate synthetase [Spiroplasma apis B31]
MDKYNSLVIVGSQWGDEGKGKITDYFAQQTNLVVRFAGGDNAGHVIKFNGQKHKVTIIPSGIFNKNVINIIGNGCVVNLLKLVEELEIIKSSGIEHGKLLISDRVHLVLPYHIKTDEFQEAEKGEKKIGTTKRGIGPCYQSKVSRTGIRIGDLKLETFKNKFKNIFDYEMKVLKEVYSFDELDFEKVYEDLISAYNKIKDHIIDCGEYLEAAIKEGKKVLFEGAQGALLDIDHGTFPYVTSSNTSANNVSIGSGIGHKLIQNTLGVVKAYCTRVGAGGFPTELLREEANIIRERGNEYGSNTKRPRRVGWLDAVALKYAIRTSGIDFIFVTLLDVLSGFDEIKICNRYILNGKEINNIPPTTEEYEVCEPKFITTPGWKEDITNVKSFNELPDAAKNYLKLIEKICEIDIVGFSVGPDRTQTVLLKNIF